jgi:DUF4097 and DUF4098 domain-containing protein YvlB
MTPPLPPRRRSLAGPIVLIVLGIVFLMGTMGVLQWYALGRLWAHYWPLLIILWGVVKLIEYQQAQREGTRPRGIGAGGVFLLIVVICFGLMASQAERFNWGALRDEIGDDSDFSLFGQSYSYDDQLEQAFPDGASLNVDNLHGAVNVNTSDGKQIKVVVHKRISAENQQDADKWNAGTKPQITVVERTVSVNANTQGAGDHWVATDLDIYIPRKAPLTISNRRGDVSVMGRDGDLQISTQHGDVSVTDINGRISLNMERGSIKASQVSGDVTVEGRVDNTSIQDVKGAVRLTGEFFEGVRLSKIAKTVSFKSSRTDMEFSSLDGDLDLDSGDLRASDLTGPMRLETRSKDVSLTGLSGDLRLKDQNGSVEVRVRKAGSLQLENRKGDIQVFLPEKTGFEVDARARGGEIASDFSELKVDNSHDQATASGSVGGGGPRLVVNNEHGDIEIRKGSAMVELPAPPNAPKAPRLPAPKDKAVEPTEN